MKKQKKFGRLVGVWSKYLSLASVCLLLWTVGVAAEAQATPTTIVSYLNTGYKFKVVSFGEGSGFEQIGFDDSGFSTGDAGFGTPSGSCTLNNPTYVKTTWPLNTDILLRKEFNLPSGVRNLKVGVAIDNDVQVFINGQDISGGLRIHEGCPSRNSFVFTAPDEILTVGTNLIAVRGRDRGVLSYIDIQITADICIDDTMAPTGAVHAHDNMLWPPNNKMVTVIIDGYVVDELSTARDRGGIGVSSAYLLVDGNEIVLKDETTDLLGNDGSFNISIEVEAVKGAVYNVELYASDTESEEAGGPNSGLVDSTYIRVPDNSERPASRH